MTDNLIQQLAEAVPEHFGSYVGWAPLESYTGTERYYYQKFPADKQGVPVPCEMNGNLAFYLFTIMGTEWSEEKQLDFDTLLDNSIHEWLHVTLTPKLVAQTFLEVLKDE